MGLHKDLDYEEMQYYQGVVIEATDADELEVSGHWPDNDARRIRHKDCRAAFSDRSNYWGIRKPPPPGFPYGQAEIPDLGCGYTGNFKLTCVQTNLPQKQVGHCQWEVDISTCNAPDHNKQLDECFMTTTTTTQYIVPVTTPTTTTLRIPTMDWMKVEQLDLEYVKDLEDKHEIPTQAPRSTCCEPHVSSVCRPSVNFVKGVDGAQATTTDGKWMPKRSIPFTKLNGEADGMGMSSRGEEYGLEGFFPMVDCKNQYKKPTSVRKCPAVKINVTDDHWMTDYPLCESSCNVSWIEELLENGCSAQRKDRERKEDQTHTQKINIMKNRRNQLEAWTRANSMMTIPSMKKVYDCIDHDRLGKLYTGWGEPEVKSGGDHLPLLESCRMHKCDQDQCLVVRQNCRIPYIHEGREIENCYDDHILRETFECQDKVGLSNSNPMSLGFGLAWVIIGGILGCIALGMIYTQRSAMAKVAPYQPSD
jgi:hypothetical protein